MTDQEALDRGRAEGEKHVSVPGPVELLQPLVAGLAVLLLLIGVIGPAIKSPQPHDIRVGLVGPPAAIQQISSGFAQNAPGAFSFTTYSSETVARAAIDSRAVAGAVLLGPDGAHLIVAGAAGDGVTGVIAGAFGSAFKAQGQAVTVETVHPFAAADPHGLILFFVVLAILVSTLIAQAIVGLRTRLGLKMQLIMLAAFSLLAAPVAMGAATLVAGDFGSGFWTATALVALASAAMGAVVLGAVRLLGAAGVGLAGLVLVLFDLVSSGGPIGSQLLPDFYRWFAPGMPAGQLYSGMRGALYFDNAGVAEPVGILSAWLAGGLLLIAGASAVRGMRERGANR
jgi:hypothetical protein